jgi:hypothetical protein
MVVLPLLWAGPALGYETDQLTHRDVLLDDAAPYADARVQDLVEEALRRTNERLRCSGDPAESQRVLAAEMERLADNPVLIPGRGFSRSFGYDRISADLELGPVDKLTFGKRDHLFGDVSFDASPILHATGVSSTIELAGVRVGTDKIDHFLIDGYRGWRREETGRDAIAWSTRTELELLGWWTSGVFSYADLAANAAGLQFYENLLAPGGVATIDESGCVVGARVFHWSDWVTEDWDEVENPSVLRQGVARDVDRWLDAHEDEVCAAYAEWADPAFEDRVQQRLADVPSYAGPRALPRDDPFELERRCTTLAPGVG